MTDNGSLPKNVKALPQANFLKISIAALHLYFYRSNTDTPDKAIFFDSILEVFFVAYN